MIPERQRVGGVGGVGGVGSVGGVGGWGRSLTPHTPHTPHTPLPTLCVRNPGVSHYSLLNLLPPASCLLPPPFFTFLQRE
ncbi:hypothetical protein [Nostoc sp. 'Peltigera membranacea cyanobiont' 210A]|uniref:hypothetical protein n=1 Tax=Nostoc sp. 'Peltigera membranacea cyanobiont' 210A TaxID=2014529 RepID=UPI00167E5D78|nr:hypothetical protein [Nostoc sp. 'Peltigera membranacea cyanobiont' 210A]